MVFWTHCSTVCPLDSWESPDNQKWPHQQRKAGRKAKITIRKLSSALHVEKKSGVPYGLSGH